MLLKRNFRKKETVTTVTCILFVVNTGIIPVLTESLIINNRINGFLTNTESFRDQDPQQRIPQKLLPPATDADPPAGGHHDT